MTSPFNRYASFYDLIYLDKDYAEEAKFIRSLIRRHLPGAKNILDLGCGTGRHAFEMGKLGFTVSGVDSSPQMLRKARARLNNIGSKRLSDIQFHHADIRNFQIRKRFDVVISLFHVMSYLPSDSGVLSMLKGARRHLKPGGLFIFDCWYGPGVIKDPPSRRVRTIKNGTLLIKRQVTPHLISNKDLVKMEIGLEVNDKRQKKSEKFCEIHPMRYFFKPAMEGMLRKSGFEPIACNAWMTNRKPRPKTWYVYFVTKAAGDF